MIDNIIVGLFTIGGSFLGSLITHYLAKDATNRRVMLEVRQSTYGKILGQLRAGASLTDCEKCLERLDGIEISISEASLVASEKVKDILLDLGSDVYLLRQTFNPVTGGVDSYAIFKKNIVPKLQKLQMLMSEELIKR